MISVTLSLAHARRLRGILCGEPEQFVLREAVDRAIRVGIRRYRPGRWSRRISGLTSRGWPSWSSYCAAAIWDDTSEHHARGWSVRHPETNEILFSGPQIGPEAQRLADDCLRAWLKAQGVEWTP